MFSISRVGEAEGFDLDIVDTDDLVVQTHDTQGHLTQDGFLAWDREMLLLTVNFEAVAESQISSVAFNLFPHILLNLLGGKWGRSERWDDWVKRDPVEHELLLFGSEV